MQNTTERRQLILEYISDHRTATMQEIAYEFSISLHTVQRDIQILSCSYPIITCQGNGGGVRVMDGWYISRRYLHDDQEALLRSILPKLQPEDQKKMEDILSAFAKPKAKG